MQEVKFLTDATTSEIVTIWYDDSDMMGVKEDVEQDVIEKSITVDTFRRITTLNQLHKLAPNKDKALWIYNQ